MVLGEFDGGLFEGWVCRFGFEGGEALVDAGKGKLMETFCFSKNLVHGKCLNTMFL